LAHSSVYSTGCCYAHGNLGILLFIAVGPSGSVPGGDGIGSDASHTVRWATPPRIREAPPPDPGRVEMPRKPSRLGAFEQRQVILHASNRSRAKLYAFKLWWGSFFIDQLSPCDGQGCGDTGMTDLPISDPFGDPDTGWKYTGGEDCQGCRCTQITCSN